jgi:excisionase family DNA binding protein
MTDVLLSPIRLNELETLIQNSVERAMKAHESKQAEPNESPDQLLTIQQAANFLSLAVPTLYSMVSRGELPYMKKSKRLYFSRIELTDYLKAGRKKTMAETASEADHYLINKKRLNG